MQNNAFTRRGFTVSTLKTVAAFLLLPKDKLENVSTGEIIRAGGFDYEKAPSGATDSHVEIEGHGFYVLPIGDQVFDIQFGVLGNLTDETAKLQALIDYAGANGKEFILTKTVYTKDLFCKHHGLRGRAVTGELLYSGVGACFNFERVGNIYPVNCDISLNIRLIKATQIGVDWRASYSTANLRLTMNSPDAEDCTGIVLNGDTEGGSGSYYNLIYIRGQGSHATGSRLVVTQTQGQDDNSNRGPNACKIIIERAGQFDVALQDKVGSGNIFEFLAIEASSAASAKAIVAGHKSNASFLSQNSYFIRYAENIDFLFYSSDQFFGVGCRLEVGMATGGQRIHDKANILSSINGVNGMLHTMNGKYQPFEVRGANSINGPVVSGLDPFLFMQDDELQSSLKIGTGASKGEGLALQAYWGDIEILRFGPNQPFGNPSQFLLRRNGGDVQIQMSGSDLWKKLLREEDLRALEERIKRIEDKFL